MNFVGSFYKHTCREEAKRAGCTAHPNSPFTGRSRHAIAFSVTAVTLAFIACVLLSMSERAHAEDIPLVDETENDKLICLGVIGARVQTDDIKGDTFDSNSHSNFGIIKFIYPGSLATGKLQVEDKIVGVDGKKFNMDFSHRLGEAIDRAEGGSGKLVLNVERGGKTIDVSFDLPKIGSYSSTFPFNCKKSDLILEQACDWLVRHMDKNGRLEDSPHIVNSAVGGLALLGSGNPKYNEPIKRLANTMVRYFDGDLGKWKVTVSPDGYWPGMLLTTWQVTYGAMFLSEYYLATKDPSVLRTLARLNLNIERRQFRETPPSVLKTLQKDEAPPYWFGHDTVSKVPSYKCLGVNTANAVLAWELISECGVAIDRDNFEKTRDYIESVGPHGDMKYSGTPNPRPAAPEGASRTGGSADAFGRTGVLGVAYAVCGDRKNFSVKIAGSLSKLQQEHYFHSHASAAMGKTWGTLALALLDRDSFHKVMDNYKFDYALVRLSDGSFAANPKSHRQSTTNKDFEEGRKWTTAFNALIYTLAKGKLRIAGRSRLLPPGLDLASVSPTVLKICESIRNGEGTPASNLQRVSLQKKSAKGKDVEDLELLEAHLMTPMNEALAKLDTYEKVGDIFQLDKELRLLKASYGTLDVFKEKTARIQKELAKDPWLTSIKLGKNYQQLLDALRRERNVTRVSDMEKFAEQHPDSIYGKWADEIIKAYRESGVIKDPSS